MNQQNLLQKISELLSRFVAQVVSQNAMGSLDINKIAENVLIPVFSEVYDLKHLVNLNDEAVNFEGIDLGDRTARAAFQITSTTDNKKVKKTLRSFVEKKYYEDFSNLVIYDITTRQNSFTGSGWNEIIGGKFAFDKNHIRDYRDLSKTIEKLPLVKIQKIAEILESQFGDGSKAGRIVQPDFTELIESCRKVTFVHSEQILSGRQTIARKMFGGELYNFLDSAVRYFFVTGASAVGKSTALARVARTLETEGWTTLTFSILPEKNFSLDYAKETVRKNFSPPLERLEWEQLIEPWNDLTARSDDPGAARRGLMIILDGLEAAEPPHIAFELARLHLSLALTSPARVKVVVSCRDTEFENFSRQKLLPFYRRAGADSEAASLLDYTTFEIKDFTNAELDEALTRISAVELLSERQAGGKFDSHAAALRNLLKHPGTFEHYADLFARGQINSIQEETWSGLIEKRLDFCLREVERETGIEKRAVKSNLIRLAAHCREQKKRDFAVDVSELQTISPDRFAESDSDGSALYRALIKSGILEERTGWEEKKSVAFKITDAGAYLLSFALEDEFKTAAAASDEREGEKQTIVSAWLNESWSFSPVRDAVLALIDRLSVSDDEEQRRELLPLLEAIISAHHDNSLFRLMKPAVLEFIFKLVKNVEEAGTYPQDYFEAAREVRYSAQNKELLRRNFNDLAPSAREMAADLTGIYGLAKFVPQLVELLKDEDENVRSAVFKACGRIGVPAIEPLLEALDNPDKEAGLKRLVVVALINVGHLNERVSDALVRQFERELNSNDDESFERLLLAAAHLRDRRQVEYALLALSHKKDKIVWYAAKFFTEVPDEKAFEPLRKILGEIVFPHSPDIYGRRHYEQVIAALVKIDRARIAPELKVLFEKALENHEKYPDGKHLFVPSRIAELAAKYDLPDCYPMLFKYLVKIIGKTPASAAVFHLTEEFEKVWNPESLEKMSQADREMAENGTDVAHLFVEAVLPYIEDDQDIYGDRLNRISHLHPVIKSQAANFTIEAGRLLSKTRRFSTKELSRNFWILGDEHAETYLLSKFDELMAKNRAAEEEQISFTVSDVARALGTCGGSKAAKRVLSFLADDARGITRNFPAETLMPLLIRKVIEPSALAELAKDEENQWIGRGVCIEALARDDAPQHLELFQNLAENSIDGNNLLLREAVIALGVTRSPLAVRPLREILRKRTVPAQIKGYAARALSAGLDAEDALPDIEEVFADLKTDDRITVRLFVNAITHFGEPSSLRILKRLENASPDISQYVAEALGTFAASGEHEREAIEKLEETTATGDGFGFFDEQSYLVRGMLKNPRNSLLELLREHLEKDRLTENSRWQIGGALRKLVRDAALDRQIVLKMTARLICDSNPNLRYNVLSLLGFLGNEFCRQLYAYQKANEATANEWTRICAIESLGYWDGAENETLKARFAKDVLVGRAADLAIRHREKRKKLKFHLKRFEQGDGLSRLGSFICLLENGDTETVRLLAQTSGGPSLPTVFAAHLRDKISERLDRAQSNLGTEQGKRLSERGTIWFD